VRTVEVECNSRKAQRETSTFGPGHAYHHGCVESALVLGEHVIAMVGNAVENAGSADPLFAAGDDVELVIAKNLYNRPIRGTVTRRGLLCTITSKGASASPMPGDAAVKRSM
jgi:hypothetical protein